MERAKVLRKYKRWGCAILILVFIPWLGCTYIDVTDTWVPRPLWYGEELISRKVSADGKFEATTIYLDGLTYGIQFVRLRDLSFPLVHPAKKIAISNLEEITKIKWTSPNELTIYGVPLPEDGSKPEGMYEVHESECYGVKIRYEFDTDRSTAGK